MIITVSLLWLKQSYNTLSTRHQSCFSVFELQDFTANLRDVVNRKHCRHLLVTRKVCYYHLRRNRKRTEQCQEVVLNNNNNNKEDVEGPVKDAEEELDISIDPDLQKKKPLMVLRMTKHRDLVSLMLNVLSVIP